MNRNYHRNKHTMPLNKDQHRHNRTSYGQDHGLPQHVAGIAGKPGRRPGCGNSGNLPTGASSNGRYLFWRSTIDIFNDRVLARRNFYCLTWGVVLVGAPDSRRASGHCPGLATPGHLHSPCCRLEVLHTRLCSLDCAL